MHNPLPTHLEHDNPFWQFSCHVWSTHTSLKDQLLQAQQHDLSVNLLLFAAWTTQQRLDTSGWCATGWQHWHEQHTRPIRALREAQSRVEEAAGLYQHLLAAELEAEQVEQAILYHDARAFPPHTLSDQALLAFNAKTLLTHSGQNTATLEPSILHALYTTLMEPSR